LPNLIPTYPLRNTLVNEFTESISRHNKKYEELKSILNGKVISFHTEPNQLDEPEFYSITIEGKDGRKQEVTPWVEDEPLNLKEVSDKNQHERIY